MGRNFSWNSFLSGASEGYRGAMEAGIARDEQDNRNRDAKAKDTAEEVLGQRPEYPGATPPIAPPAAASAVPLPPGTQGVAAPSPAPGAALPVPDAAPPPSGAAPPPSGAALPPPATALPPADAAPATAATDPTAWRKQYTDWLDKAEKATMRAYGIEGLTAFRASELEKARRTMIGHTTGAVFSAAKGDNATAVKQLNAAAASQPVDLGVEFSLGPDNTIRVNGGDKPVSAEDLYNWQTSTLATSESFLDFMKYTTGTKQVDREQAQRDRQLDQGDRALGLDEEKVKQTWKALGLDEARLGSDDAYRAISLSLEKQRLDLMDKEIDAKIGNLGGYATGSATKDDYMQLLKDVVGPLVNSGQMESIGINTPERFDWFLSQLLVLKSNGVPATDAFMTAKSALDGKPPGGDTQAAAVKPEGSW